MVKDTLKRIGLMLVGAAIATAILYHAQNPPPRCSIYIIKEKSNNFVDVGNFIKEPSV